MFMFDSLPEFLLAITFLIFLKTWIKRIPLRRILPYPPGPEGLLVIGNLLDVPSIRPWLTYLAWGEKYNSDIIHFEVLGEHVVVLNSLAVTNALLEKRSRIYSDRPRVPMVQLMGWNFNIGMMPYGDYWRQHRRMMQKAFRKDATPIFQPAQRTKVNDMLRQLHSAPEDFLLHVRTFAAAVVMATVYGHDIAPVHDRFVDIAEQATTKLLHSVFPGAVMVNAMPFLRHVPSWFPGAGFKKYAEEAKALTDEMQNVPLEFVKKNMADGTATSSFAAQLLNEHNVQGGSKEDEEVIKHVTGTAYAAGADTTSSVLGTAFYAFAISPLVQQRAQFEIDSVVGADRLPDFEDRPHLPYVEAIYREVMRWKPVAPLGVAHCTTEDDVYGGYFIPKGATVMANIWAMAHDPRVYTIPEEFNPDRFFDFNGDLDGDDTILAYGFGRRVCAGRHMANDTIWLALARLLACYTISQCKDEYGNEIPLSVDYSNGFVIHPQDFKCVIKPRSEAAERLVHETSPGYTPATRVSARTTRSMTHSHL